MANQELTPELRSRIVEWMHDDGAALFDIDSDQQLRNRLEEYLGEPVSDDLREEITTWFRKLIEYAQRTQE